MGQAAPAYTIHTKENHIGLSIYLNKQLNVLAKTLDALESFNTPSDVEQIVDYAARLNIMSKRAAALCDECKETLWSNIGNTVQTEGFTFRGDKFNAFLQIVLQERFDIKDFKEAHPRLFKQFLHEVVQQRTSFKARG